eukprot:SAG31_NODE_1180_length_9525_cov_4.989497_9_plen_71_part_00
MVAQVEPAVVAQVEAVVAQVEAVKAGVETGLVVGTVVAEPLLQNYRNQDRQPASRAHGRGCGPATPAAAW